MATKKKPASKAAKAKPGRVILREDKPVDFNKLPMWLKDLFLEQQQRAAKIAVNEAWEEKVVEKMRYNAGECERAIMELLNYQRAHARGTVLRVVAQRIRQQAEDQAAHARTMMLGHKIDMLRAEDLAEQAMVATGSMRVCDGL